jgi:hypothetical protein
MRKLALTAVLALLLGPGAAARATTEPLPTDTGCSFSSVAHDAVDGGRYHGVIHSGPVAAAALPPPADPLANPVSLTVICTLHVEFGPTPDPAITASGSGTVVAAVAPTAVSYNATDLDTVAVCTTAVLTDAHGATYTYSQSDNNGMWYQGDGGGCDGAHCLEAGPDCSYEIALVLLVLDQVWPVAYTATGAIDDATCSQLPALSPGVPGVVDVAPDGDTYVGGEFVADCPPYA